VSGALERRSLPDGIRGQDRRRWQALYEVTKEPLHGVCDNAFHRSHAIAHPPVDAPLCLECRALELTFFDPNCPGCKRSLMSQDCDIGHVFAALRQWVPQVSALLRPTTFAKATFFRCSKEWIFWWPIIVFCCLLQNQTHVVFSGLPTMLPQPPITQPTPSLGQVTIQPLGPPPSSSSLYNNSYNQPLSPPHNTSLQVCYRMLMLKQLSSIYFRFFHCIFLFIDVFFICGAIIT